MDTLSIPLTQSLTVFCTSAANDEPVCQLIAEMAIRGPVIILDGGNCFPAYRLLRLLRLRVPDPFITASRALVQRAFTCYQMVALLEQVPIQPQPYLLLDPFATFYDEQVPLPEIQRLLESCLCQLERLRQTAPAFVSLPPAHSDERLFLIERVCEIADHLYMTEFTPALIYQPALL